MSIKVFRTMAITAASLLILMVSMASAADVVRIGTDGGAEPWTFTNSAGELIGFDIEVGNEICKRMNVKCEWVINDWDGIFPALQLGKFDMVMAGLNETAERRKSMDFSRGYAVTLFSFAAKKDSKLLDYKPGVDVINFDEMTPEVKAELSKIQSATKGLSVGVQTGSNATSMVEKIFESLKLREYSKMETRDLDIQAERIELGVAAAPYWRKVEKKSNVDIKMFGPKFGGGELGGDIVAAIRKGNPDLNSKVDAAINSMIEDGTLKALNIKWLGSDSSPKK